MAENFTIASIIDKNKIDSNNPWLLLLTVFILDESKNLVDTLYLVKNNENFTWNGIEYTAFNFTHDFADEINNEPSLSITAQDLTGVITQKMMQYNGGVGSTCNIKVVSVANSTSVPEIEMNYDILGASKNNTTINWKLGTENPLKYKFPMRLQYRDRCPFIYKSDRCKYTGVMPSCDYTLYGDNGCKAHGNTINFGGFPSLRNSY